MSHDVVHIDITTARRFILGKQGLWPGRRWKGKRGADAAMRAMEHLQLDPLVYVARNQDIALYGRVIGYAPGGWETLTYRERKFFDWGGWLAVRPMEELPYWRALMRREREHPGWVEHAAEHADAIAEMREVVRARGPVSNRDFEMGTRKRLNTYRGRKDSAVALYYLWRMGELMVHHRQRFERWYDLTERIAPAEFIREVDDAAADRYFLRKLVAFYGLHKLGGAHWWLSRSVKPVEMKAMVSALRDAGDIVPVRVEGWKSLQFALAEDAPLLAAIAAGRTPREWKPLDTTTTDEVTFLAPLDNVSSRGRAKELFDFEYTWEVYIPEHQRKWGYYNLPVLWGDDLVARVEFKLDRASNTLLARGFWPEEKRLAKDEAFGEAFARGVARFKSFVGAERLDAKGIPLALRKRLVASGD